MNELAMRTEVCMIYTMGIWLAIEGHMMHNSSIRNDRFISTVLYTAAKIMIITLIIISNITKLPGALKTCMCYWLL